MSNNHTSKYSQVSEIEKDILKEIVNIGLAKAADAFAVLAKEKVFLTSPSLHIVESKKINEVVEEFPDYVFLVQSELSGDLKGKSLISFRSDHISRITEVCIGDRGLFDGKYRELQASLLLEVCNMIIGSLLTQLSNLLNMNIYGTPPQQTRGGIYEYLQRVGHEIPDYTPVVCLINTTFQHSGRMVDLPLMLILTRDALEKLLTVIRTKAFNQDGFNNALTEIGNAEAP